MTHATKAIYKFLLSDYVKISTVSIESFLLIKKKKSTVSIEDILYDEQDILHSMYKIEVS